jgi:DNA-binding IclR family transcriptional regulator
MSETKAVNAIIRGGNILRILGKGVTRLEDIYQEVGLSRSTTHRILKSLVAAGFAYQDSGNRNYYVGPLVLQLASDPIISHQILVTGAVDELRLLRDLIDETVLLIIENGNQRLVLKQIRSRQKLAYHWDVGSTGPIYIGSSGKLLLSHLPDSQVAQLLGNIDHPESTSDALIDVDGLKQEIQEIRKKGYATSVGEDYPGSTGISVPISGYTIPVALCVLGPEFRLKPDDVLSKMIKTASRIEEKLKTIFNNVSK